MKFNGKNIIFDDDITLTSEGLEGKKLSDVLRGLQSKTSKLESYMKWLYQYGGVGGNGGGGGGSQSGYSLYVTVGGIQVTGGTLNLSSGEDEWYDLVVKIQNPEGANVRIGYTYYYKNDSGTKIKAGNDILTNPIVLNSSNSYTYSTRIRLNCNDKLTINGQDDLFGIDKQINCDIITNNYTFNAFLAKENGDAWSDSGRGAEIFTEETGSLEHCNLNIAIDYDVAIAVTSTYNWSFVAKDKVFQGSGNLTQGSPGSGRVMIPLIFDNNELDRFLANESDAGYYSITLSIAVDMSSVGQISGDPWTKSMTFNLIPQNLYLLVSSTTGTIYTSPTTASDRYEFNPGIIGFHVNSYRGNDGGTSCIIEYRVDGNDGDKFTGIKSSTIRTEEDITDVNITNTETIEGHNEHEHWIDFRLTSLNDQYPQNANYVRYYFYVKPLESKVDYPWADGESSRAGHFNIFRNGIYGGPTFSNGKLTGDNLKSLYDLKNGAPFQQSTGSSPLLINDITYPSTGLYTTIINIGLQYSEINSDTGSIFTAAKGNETDTYLTIKQDSIQFGTDATVKYYFPKTIYESFSSNSMTEYHLLSIVQRLVSKVGNNTLYEVTVYIDGILEGAARNYVSHPLNFSSFTLESCNCFLNLFEVSYLTWTETMPTGIEDLNIYQYWLKYNNEMRLQELGTYDVSILSFVNKFTMTDNGTVMTEDRDSVANIATMAGVPTLVMTIRDDNDSVFNEMNLGYDENDDLKYDVSIEWSDGKNQLAPVMIPNAMPNAQFVASLQGSSTKKYKCKNWNLSLVNNSSEDKNTVARYLYSPNFSYPTEETIRTINAETDEARKREMWKEYTDTFLPEEEFTLKADVVDSSHSNNTSIGRFVNDITTNFATGQQNKTLGKYVKNCLEGFPIVVYICLSRTVNGTTTNKYYYQGVYNFNLGRTSYYNLGYKNIDVFVDKSNILVGNAGSSFTFYQVEVDDDNIMNGLLVAEIQGNSPYFDFSQYDKSILFNQGPSDKEYMFGDIEKASQSMTQTEAEDVLSNLVKLTSQAGGFLFENVLRKTISNSESDMYGYEKGYNATLADGETPANQVPNYKKNIVKKNVKGVYTFSVEGEDKTAASATALDNFLGTDEEDGQPAFFDYQSLSEYYTICMAFGLVDSVQKNMNIKSWDANKEADGTYKGKFYAAFYDMDTCLGINNAGKDTTYFAFSDYWDHDDSDKTSDGTVTPKPINIYRDYSPKNKTEEEGGGDYYDTASSYLFAVAKYAIYYGRFQSSVRTQYWPKRLWALWRTTSTGTGLATAGCLSSAKKFMEKYFQNNLGKVSIPLINMNYRNKYFVFTNNEGDETNSFSKRNFDMFNGTRIHKAEDWLNGRFHILDAYFNLADANSPIQYYDENGNFVDVPSGNGALTEPVNSSSWGYSLNLNPDITVLQDIFTKDTSSNSGSGTIDIRVKAREFTPLFIGSSTKAFRYLLSANTTYKIYQDLSGLQEFKFGGSINWVELNSINTLPFSSLYVNSKYLENLSGSARTLSIDGADIIMPSLKNLNLTGPNYSINFTGDSQLTYEKFPNLVEVNFSNVKSCNAVINGSKFTTLSLANILAGEIEINNCEDMTSLNMGIGTESSPSPQLQKLIINPVSEGIRKLNWYRTGIKSIQLTNSSTKGDSSFSLNYDETVESISLTGFATVNIQNCPNLKSISIGDNDSRGDKLTSLTIIKCGTRGSEFHVNSETNGVVDLSKCNYLKICGGLSGMSNIKEIHFSKNASAETGSTTVEVAKSCFVNDTNLQYVSGSQIVITGPSTFQNCNAFTMMESGERAGMTNLYVKAGVSDLSGMFSISNGGSSISRSIIKQFMEGNSHWGNKASVTNMSSMFHGQYGITYTEANLKTDLSTSSSSKLRIDLRDFVNLSNVSSMFAWSGVAAYHPDTLGFGKNVTSISFSNFSIGVGTIAICPKSLLNIIRKVTAFGPTDVNYAHGFVLLNSDGSRATTASLRNYFMGTDAWNNSVKPEKVKTLYGLYVNSACRCDMTGFFGSGSTTNWPALTSIYTTLKNRQTNYTGINASGVNTLNVNYFYESFNVPSGVTIDLWTFFNWDKVLTKATPFDHRRDTTSAYELGCINMPKTITGENLRSLWTKILNARSVTSLNNFFTNCSVTNGDKNLLSLFGASVSSPITRITSLSCTFRNFSVTEEGATASSPIIIDHFLSVFPNVTNFIMCFRDTNIGKQLPRDFFGRRQKDGANSKTGVYFTKKEPVVSEKVCGNDTLSKIWADDNTTTFEQGNVTKFNYRTGHLQLQQMFYNVTWERYGDNGSNDIEHSAKCYRPENDDTEIEPNYFEIDGNKFYDTADNGYKKLGGTTADKDKTVYYIKKIHTYNVITRYEDDEEGNPQPVYEQRTADYYEASSTVTKGDENSEITDLSVPKSDHVNEFNSISGNVKLYNNQIDDPDNLFIAPDFFYCVSNTTSSNITNVFNAGNVANVNRLEGMIPEHMLKNCKSLNFAGLFSGLNITPRYWKTFSIGNGEQEAYVYVPQNFTSYTTLNGAFNFNLNVPTSAGDNETYKKYYVMFENSIPARTTTLSNSLPSNWPGQEGTYVNFGANGYTMGTHYNIMIKQTSGGEPTEGIDMSHFSALRCNNLVGSNLSQVLHGRLFNSSFFVENLRMTANDQGIVTDYVVTAMNYGSNVCSVSRNLIFPSTGRSNLSDVHILAFTTTGGITISRSQINECTDAMAAAYQTIPRTDGNASSHIIVIS